jgi:methionyl-tRNA formyltransferase
MNNRAQKDFLHLCTDEASLQKNPGVPIRMVFCTNGGVPGAVVLRTILCDPGFDVIGIVRSTRVFRAKYGFLRGALHFFIRCGIPYTVYIWLITTAAEVAGSLFRIGTASVEHLASRSCIPVFETKNINDLDGRQFLRRLNPELLVCAHFDQKLDVDLCDGDSYATINIHPSILPDHKGLDPVIQTLIADKKKIGVTVHRVLEALDSGSILAQEHLETDFHKSVFATQYCLLRKGAELLTRKKDILLDRSSGVPQEGHGSYESWPTPDDIRALYQKGGRLIRTSDFSMLKNEF